MGIFRWLHRWRARIVAVLLLGALLVAERPYTVIIELCLWSAVIAVCVDVDEPTPGQLPFWATVWLIGSGLILLAYGGIWL